MPVNLSIKNAPDDVVQRLKARAARHHRSLQGELLAIIEEAVRMPSMLTPQEILAEVRGRELATPAEAATIVRADRDAVKVVDASGHRRAHFWRASRGGGGDQIVASRARGTGAAPVRVGQYRAEEASAAS